MAKDIGGISSRIWGSDIPERVKNKLRTRQNLARGIRPNESISDYAPTDYDTYSTNFSGEFDLHSRIPWTRFWTAVSITRFVENQKWENIVDDDDYNDNVTIDPNYEYFYDGDNETVYEKSRETKGTRIYQVGNHVFNQFYQTDIGGGINADWLSDRGVPYGHGSEQNSVVEDIDHLGWAYDMLHGRNDPTTNRSTYVSQGVGADEAEYEGDKYSGLDENYGILAAQLFPDEYQIQENKFFSPPAGIKSVTSQTEGFGAIKTTKVAFKVFNWNDFEHIYSRYVLRPGALVVVDFGWDTSHVYNPNTLLQTLDEDQSTSFADFLFGEQGVVTLSEGDMDTLVGNVVDYSAKMADDGSVDCEIEVLSQNGQLLSYDLDKWDFIREDIVTNLELDLIQHVVRTIEQEGGGSSWTGFSDSRAREVLKSGEPDDISAWTMAAEKWASKYLAPGSDTAVDVGMGDIPLLAVEKGALFVPSLSEDTLSNNKNIYMQWGLVEDFVLNHAFANGDSDELDDINQSDDSNSNPVKWDSRGSFVIWDDNLEMRQKISENPTALPMMYPPNWDTSYNRIMKMYDPRQYLEADDNPDKQKSGGWKNASNELTSAEAQYCLAEYEYKKYGTQSFYWKAIPVYGGHFWWMGSRGADDPTTSPALYHRKFLKSAPYSGDCSPYADLGGSLPDTGYEWWASHTNMDKPLDYVDREYEEGGYAGYDWENCYTPEFDSRDRWLESKKGKTFKMIQHGNGGCALNIPYSSLEPDAVQISSELLDNFVGWTWDNPAAGGLQTNAMGISNYQFDADWPWKDGYADGATVDTVNPYDNPGQSVAGLSQVQDREILLWGGGPYVSPGTYFGYNDSTILKLIQGGRSHLSSKINETNGINDVLGVIKNDAHAMGTIHSKESILYQDNLLEGMSEKELRLHDFIVEIQFENPWGLTVGESYRCIDMPGGSKHPDRWTKGQRVIPEVQMIPVEKEFTKFDKSQHRVPLRDMFIQVYTIKRAFLESSTVGEAVNKILDSINEASDGITDLALTSIDYHNKEMAVIDRNYVSKINNDTSGQNFGDLFQFRLNDPSSFVKSYELEFKMPSDDYGSMIALQGMTGGQMFPVNDVIDWNLSIKILEDFVNGSNNLQDYQVTYQPHPQRFRGKKLQEKAGNAFHKTNKKVSIFDSSKLLNQKMYSKKTAIATNEDDITSIEQVVSLARNRSFKKFENQNFTKPNTEEKLAESLSQVHKLQKHKNTVNSAEEMYLRKAKQNHFMIFNSLLLPVELSIDIYGISSFITGDLIKIDHMPARVAGRIYFQVMAIDHDISDSGWLTTLTCIMRMRNVTGLKQRSGIYNVSSFVTIKKSAVQDMVGKDVAGEYFYTGEIPWNNMSQFVPYYDQSSLSTITAYKFKWTGENDNFAQIPILMWSDTSDRYGTGNSNIVTLLGAKEQAVRNADDSGPVAIPGTEGAPTIAGWGTNAPYLRYNIAKDGKTSRISPIMESGGDGRRGYIFQKHLDRYTGTESDPLEGKNRSWMYAQFYVKLNKGERYLLLVHGSNFFIIPDDSTEQVKKSAANWLKDMSINGDIWARLGEKTNWIGPIDLSDEDKIDDFDKISPIDTTGSW